MLLGKKLMIFDGGFGTELEKRGLGGIPEDLNITHAEEIKDIHLSYSAADFITANSFGLNRIKYRGKYKIDELARAAIENARVAGKVVFFDVGPTGMMLAPTGTLSFDEAYNAYAEIAVLTRGKVDGYIAETFSDIYELKACVLALKENSDAPVFATMTFGADGRTLTGSTPEIAAAVLEGLGVDALGVNCSLGPKELAPIVERLLASTTLPVVVQPNCGLPVLENGRSHYTLSIDEFAFYAEKFADMGVAILGGCCGTTPEFISRIAALKGRDVPQREVERKTVVTSCTRYVTFDGVKICGERLNPTGKPKLKEALLKGDFDYLVNEAIAQAEAGADILDLNVGVPGIDEASVMKSAVEKVQEYVELPLQIDSSSMEAIERAARYYNGVPLINSVNGDDDVLDKILPVVKKYGAVVLGLCMDGRGVPGTANERFEIAEKIVRRAERFGIPRRNVMIDTLVLTASAEQSLVKETLKALEKVKALGVKTALGVSNVSFGLPARGLINKTFLAMALERGLDMPILNPLDSEMTGVVKAYGVLSGDDIGSEEFIRLYKDYTPAAQTRATAKRETEANASTLYECIVRGLKSRAKELCESELSTREPMDVVNGILLPALDKVGRLYEAGKLFLPQLVSAAEAAKESFAAVTEKLPKGKRGKGTVVLATVKGDVHDIGKNIVKVVLESYGYDVIDLGKDTPPEKAVDAAKRHSPIAVGLSALMTTTVKGMEETIRALKNAHCPCPIFVGGAVLNAEIAKEIDADYYTKDALEFVKVLEKVKRK